MRKTLLLASEVRSGSSYIAESVAYYLDKRFSYSFYDLSKELFSSLSDLSSESDITEIFSTLYLDNSGWASSKLMCRSLSVVTREARRSEVVKSMFFGPDTCWIIVRRRDKIGQAVSLATARKSGIYHYYDDINKSPDMDIELSNKEIEESLRSIELSDIYLDLFCKSLNPERYLEVFYEDFLRGETGFIGQVCKAIGLDHLVDEDAYSNSAKLRPTARQKKSGYSEEFKFWLLENYHPT